MHLSHPLLVSYHRAYTFSYFMKQPLPILPDLLLFHLSSCLFNCLLGLRFYPPHFLHFSLGYPAKRFQWESCFERTYPSFMVSCLYHCAGEPSYLDKGLNNFKASGFYYLPELDLIFWQHQPVYFLFVYLDLPSLRTPPTRSTLPSAQPRGPWIH